MGFWNSLFKNENKETIRPNNDERMARYAKCLYEFEHKLGGYNIAKWSNPKGGYFINLDVYPGTAKRVWELCRDAGVTLTNAGATYPYGIDPEDKNLRIAPSYPPVDELLTATKLLCLCVKIAATEKLLEEPEEED